MPRILFAQTDAPTPLPQIATPRSTFPGGHGLREREHIIRIVIIFAQVMCPEIDDLVSRFAKLAEQLLLQTKSTVIGGDPNAHMLFLMLLVLTARPGTLIRPSAPRFRPRSQRQVVSGWICLHTILLKLLKIDISHDVK
jgi:hypothetical protein